MCRLRCGGAPFHLAGCALVALLLAGCTADVEGPPPSELLSAGGRALGFHRQGASRHLTSARQDMIVALAIAAHEMHHP